MLHLMRVSKTKKVPSPPGMSGLPDFLNFIPCLIGPTKEEDIPYARTFTLHTVTRLFGLDDKGKQLGVETPKAFPCPPPSVSTTSWPLVSCRYLHHRRANTNSKHQRLAADVPG